jgi:uncharacterized membrane protein (DUF485 family)
MNPLTTSPGDSAAIKKIALRRMGVGLLLTVVMFVFYASYLLLNAYAKGFLSQQLVPGVTIALIAGFLSILLPCILAGIYMRWANRNLDAACDQLGQGGAK